MSQRLLSYIRSLHLASKSFEIRSDVFIYYVKITALKLVDLTVIFRNLALLVLTCSFIIYV